MTQSVTLTSDITVELIESCARDTMVARAARVSTLAEVAAIAAEEKSNGGLIRRLLKEKHGSPFEHTFFNFRVHMPLAMALEHVRHRVGWSYNGESARYKEMDPCFYMPGDDRALVQTGKPMDYEMSLGSDFQRIETQSSFQRIANETFAEYLYLLNIGVAREVARYLLPQALMVTYYTSCNARSLMHFLSLRTQDDDATFVSKPQHEIELVARGYERALEQAMPLTYGAYCKYGRVAP